MHMIACIIIALLAHSETQFRELITRKINYQTVFLGILGARKMTPCHDDTMLVED